MTRTLAALCFASVATAAAAQDAARWYLQVDNDVVFGTDRWYSSGVRLARVQRYGSHEIEVGVLQEIYTPEARFFERGRTDRAPTARLLLSLARHDRSAELFQTLELAAGVNGPAALGRQASDLIHRVIAAPEVDWSRQEGNRFDGSLIAARTHDFGFANLHYGVVAGTRVAFAHAGGELRMGAGGARSISSPMLRFAATPPFPVDGAGLEGWGAFVGASGRAVARNELLARGYEVDAPSLDRTRGIARIAAGVTWAHAWGSVAFAVAQDSREFERQRKPHRFGSLTVHAAF